MRDITKSKLSTFALAIATALIVGGASVALAALNFSATGITGDGNVVIDSPGTISIGSSTATRITIGNASATTTLPGNLSIVGTCTGCFAPTGDLSGTAASQVVAGIEGRPVSSTAPTANQVLQYNGSLWVPVTLSVGSSSNISINAVMTSTYMLSDTANQIIISTTTTPGVLVWSLPTNLVVMNASSVNQYLSGYLSVGGAATLSSTLIQSGGIVSLASTTINGNATTTGNLTVIGSLLDAGGNKYSTSTGGTSPFVIYGISDTVSSSDSGDIFVGPVNSGGTAPVTGNNSNFAAAQNVAIGDKSMLAITSGIHDVAIGAGDLQSLTTASHVIGVGHANANVLQTRDFNLFLGWSNALNATTLGTHNIFIGDSVAGNTTGGTGITNNIGIGSGVFGSLTNGYDNVGLGTSACASVSTGIADTCIGQGADVGSGGANFSISIGYDANAASGAVAIGQQVTNSTANSLNIGANAKVFYRAGTSDVFSALPACSSGYEGAQRPVSDSATTTFGSIVTGGGSNHVLAYCDGTNWTVMAQ